MGHGTLSADEFVRLAQGAGVARIVDIRRFPASRRHPHFHADAMSRWLADAGLGYTWEPDLGGRRTPLPASVHTALRVPAFRGYADHMASPAFRAALDRVLGTSDGPTALLCAESVWWRCHRRLVADAVVALHRVAVFHLLHDGRRQPHALTGGARVEHGSLRYDGGAMPLG